LAYVFKFHATDAIYDAKQQAGGRSEGGMTMMMTIGDGGVNHVNLIMVRMARLKPV
jgi:hypothetical protein